MKKLRISKIWIAVVVIVIVAVAAWAMSGGKKEEDINFKEEKVALKTLQNSVTATGTIEAVTSVTVGTQVSGIVNKLYVDYNSQVKKGQVIAELDKTNLLSELNTAKANLASAQSSLNYQATNMERYKTLYKKGLVSADEYENARRKCWSYISDCKGKKFPSLMLLSTPTVWTMLPKPCRTRYRFAAQ